MSNTTNILDSLRFKMVIERTPAVNFWGRSIVIPSKSIGEANMNNRFTNIPFRGDHTVYGPLDVTFIVDDKMNNYSEISDWMDEISFPHDHGQYGRPNLESQITKHESNFSDISVFLYTSKDNPAYEFVFENAWPSDLSSFNINIANEEVTPIEVSATFKYTRFYLKSVR